MKAINCFLLLFLTLAMLIGYTTADLSGFYIGLDAGVYR